MPRQARIDAPGALHHIICRGIERSKIFKTKQDYTCFLSRLAALVRETNTACYAWALIPNHFHLLLATGEVPIATFMRRLLTGYAVSFNHRYRRHGHVFQNRYKSILCQEDAYLLELVRYIHLNPLRARLVTHYHKLSSFPYSGHGALAGVRQNDWQNVSTVLALFHEKPRQASRRYVKFVEEGVVQGKRSDLTWGGLVQSIGGWAEVRQLCQNTDFSKSDKRILGDSDFVGQILKTAEESLLRKEVFRSHGVTPDHVLDIVVGLTGVTKNEILVAGKTRPWVQARSLVCYWDVRELGISMTDLAGKAGLSVPAISMSVQRGEKIAKDKGYSLLELINLKT